MPSTKILLFGKIGQVGWELRRTLAPLGDLICIDFPEVDLTKPDSIRTWIRDTAPKIIVNAAAYTAVDKAESDPALANKINGEAPAIMAEEAKRRGALLVHYSTDYVFDGTKTTPYVEDDPPNPLSVYGRSKLAGDTAIQQIGGNYLIFRLCWVYGSRGSNFLLTMMRLARERENLRVVADQIGCPTTSRLIAETTALALQHARRSDPDARGGGVYHLCCSGQASWHEFARAIVDRMPAAGRKCRTVEAITSADYPTPAKRPAYSVMSCARLHHTFGLTLPDWQDALSLVLET
jgi:dTDP-4-dehydrorhamnose reductase